MDAWRINLDHIAGVIDMNHTKDDLPALREFMRTVSLALRDISQSPAETPPPPKLTGARSWLIFDPSGRPTDFISHVDKRSAEMLVSAQNNDIPWDSLKRQGFTARPLWWTSVEKVDDYDDNDSEEVE